MNEVANSPEIPRTRNLQRYAGFNLEEESFLQEDTKEDE